MGTSHFRPTFGLLSSNPQRPTFELLLVYLIVLGIGVCGWAGGSQPLSQLRATTIISPANWFKNPMRDPDSLCICLFFFFPKEKIGIVQKVFSEKASAIARMRQKCVRNASKMRLVLLGKEERSKMRQKCVKIASEMRQKCAEHLWGRTPSGRYRKKGSRATPD